MGVNIQKKYKHIFIILAYQWKPNIIASPIALITNKTARSITYGINKCLTLKIFLNKLKKIIKDNIETAPDNMGIIITTKLTFQL